MNKQFEELIATTEQAISILNRIKKFYEHNGFDADPFNCVVCKIESLMKDFSRDDEKLTQYKTQRQALSAEEQ